MYNIYIYIHAPIYIIIHIQIHANTFKYTQPEMTPRPVTTTRRARSGSVERVAAREEEEDTNRADVCLTNKNPVELDTSKNVKSNCNIVNVVQVVQASSQKVCCMATQAFA